MNLAVSEVDTVYAQQQMVVNDFSFDERVASVFSDMIERSIPGYRHILNQLGKLTTRFCQKQAYYYDLGCSLGAATLAMRQNINQPEGRIFAVDNSAAMLDRCQTHVSSFNFATPVTYQCCDILEIDIHNAAIVSLNFTLQFIPPDHRQTLIETIYQGLRPGGLLFLSEKLIFPDESINALLIDLHHQFKRENGYSELEISQKRSALEHVMRPDTAITHKKRLQNAGFDHVSQWYQNLNFASFLAIK